MSKPKGKRRPEGHPKASPSLSQPTRLMRVLRGLVAMPLRRIGSFASLIVSVAGVFGLGYDALRLPEVSPPVSYSTDPFDLHFMVRNPSYLFAMRSINLECHVPSVIWARGGGIKNATFRGWMNVVDLETGESLEYRCPVNFAIVRNEFTAPVSATVYITGHSLLLGWSRSFKSHSFNWDVRSNSWIEGTLVN